MPKYCVENALPAVCESDRKALNPTINLSDNKFADQQGYEYDENGNVTKDTDNRTFTYDALNKQVKVKDINNQTLGEYFYDGESKRVKKTSNNENIVFVYDAFGALVEEFTIDNAQPQLPAETQTTYLTTDTLGSPRVITDENGEVVSRRDFLPFGEEILANENNRKLALGYNTGDNLRQKFTGYEKDNETDLEFAQNRYYANKLGRFTSPDPLMASAKALDPQSLNRFTYVKNNPLNLIDPDGLMACDPKKEHCWFDKNAEIHVDVDTSGGGLIETTTVNMTGTLTPKPVDTKNRKGGGCGWNIFCHGKNIWDKITGGGFNGDPSGLPGNPDNTKPGDGSTDPGNKPDPGDKDGDGIPDDVDKGGLTAAEILVLAAKYGWDRIQERIKEYKEQWTKVGWWTTRAQYEKMIKRDRTIPKNPLAGAAWYSIEGPNDYQSAPIGSVYFEFEVKRKDLLIPGGADTWAISVHLPGANVVNTVRLKAQGGEFSPKYRNPTGILHVKKRHGDRY